LNYKHKLQHNQKGRAIAGRTTWCRCKYRYVLKFTAASHGFYCDSNTFELNNSKNHGKITVMTIIVVW